MIEDMFEVYSERFLKYLEAEISYIKHVIDNTSDQGDYRRILELHLSVVQSAHDEAKIQYDYVFTRI